MDQGLRPRHIAEKAVSALVGHVRNALLSDKRVLLMQLGTFYLVDTVPRRYRNLQTGKLEVSESRRLLKFVLSNKLKAELNGDIKPVKKRKPAKKDKRRG